MSPKRNWVGGVLRLLLFFQQHVVCHFSGKQFNKSLKKTSHEQFLGRVDVSLAIQFLIVHIFGIS